MTIVIFTPQRRPYFYPERKTKTMSETYKNTATYFQGLYQVTEKWISDLLFAKDELKFLQKLLNRYFSEMTQLENLDEIRESTMRLQELHYQYSTLSKNLKTYQSKLVKAIDSTQEVAPLGLTKIHNHWNDELTVFLKNTKASKKEIFSISEHVLEALKNDAV